MSKQPFNGVNLPNATAESYGPFTRTTEEDHKVTITHFAPKNTGDLLRDIESGIDYHVSNGSISEVKVVETVTITLTRNEGK